ncbi:MAG: energy transducer TonB [Gammaproteobacteria bacterium]|nr:MAG: energy transducer TonB [Gammaproteobacteria bacterium]
MNTDISPTLTGPGAGNESLLVSLLLAAAFHALVLLGVSFDFEQADHAAPSETLDVELVPQRPSPPPRHADYLAEHSQQGAGNTRRRVRFQQAQRALPAVAPRPTGGPPRPRPPVLVARKAQRPVPVSRQRPSKPAPKPVPDPERLLERSRELINLEAQLRQELKAYSHQPRETFISASTRQYRYAAYMNAWVAKVERIGNLNYPDEARRRGLSGSLILDVALRADGSIYNITIRKPSGYRVLDEAAIRIVRLAAPFPPFPPEIRKDTDILHIVRTWEFISGRFGRRQ